MRLFAVVPWELEEGTSNDSGVIENGNFQPFAGYLFVNFRDEARVIM